MPKLSPKTIALLQERNARAFPQLRGRLAPRPVNAAAAPQPMPRGVTIMPATMSAAPSPPGVTIMPASPAARPSNVKIQAGPRAAPPNVLISKPQPVPALRDLPLAATAQARQPTALELEGQRVLAEARRLEELEAAKTPAIRLIELAIERVRRPVTAAPVLEHWPEGLDFEQIDQVVRSHGTAERGQMGVTTGQVIQILQAWRRAHDERTAPPPASDTPAIQPNSASDALGSTTRTE